MALVDLELLVLLLVMLITALQLSALQRNGAFLFGNFRRYDHQYLMVEKVTSSLAKDSIDCGFLCVKTSNCFSFNIALTPDQKGVYLCELLSTDKYRATDKLHANTSFHHYSPWSPCESSPCKNSAVCVPEYESNSYHCDCKPGYVGTHCERRVSGETCSHIRSRQPNSTTGMYVIDPDKEGIVTPFTVYCDMSDKNGVGVTVISHDSEDTTLVAGYGSPGSYSRDIHYAGASLSQLASLTEQSAHCEQFIMYECRGSVLLYNGYPRGWWVSRDGNDMTYWGGVTSGNYKCACGLTNTCANLAYGCNCDKNDQVWREDSGLLTNKAHLPVKQLRFGDTWYHSSVTHRGYHTLGKLKCYGIA